ncbi:MAG TPA: twin-arginine translocase TatA/TatE family subunit [Gemmatimonadales bacterium]|jgi:sec-independent protein translocase protein TatA
MGNLSVGEIAILVTIALLVFGGKGLPEAGRTIGKGLREFRRALNEAQDAMGRTDDLVPPAAASRPPADAEPKRLLD